MLFTSTGSFLQATTTGNQSVTGLGFQPKLVLFFGNNLTADGSAANCNGAFGWALSSTNRMAGTTDGGNNLTSATNSVDVGFTSSLCYQVINYGNPSPTVVSACDFVSMDSDGFTVNWSTTDGTQRVVNYFALGGSSIFTLYSTSTLKTPTATGQVAYTGVGFKPDAVMFFMPRVVVTDPLTPAEGSSNWSFGFAISSNTRGTSGMRNKDGTPTVARRQQSASECLTVVGSAASVIDADLVSMDKDGFTLSYTKVDVTAYLLPFIAFKGGNYKVGSFNQNTTTQGTGNQSITGVGFRPTGLILVSVDNVTATGNQSQGRFSFGTASSATQRGCVFMGDTDTANPTVESQDVDRTKVIKMLTEGGATTTTNAAADFVSFDVDGFTINNTTVDATAREIIYFAMGSKSNLFIPGNELRPRIFGPGIAR